MFGIHSLRRTAGATLFFFVWMILYPALAAAVQPTPVTASAPSSVKQDPNTLEALRDTAQRARAKAERGEDSNTEESQLLQSAEVLDKEQRQAEAEFADIGKHLETHHLPNEIKQRHAEAVADYRSKMKALKARVNDFKAAHTRRDKTGTRQRLSELSDFLDKAQKHRHQQPFDPNDLPNTGIKPKTDNQPKLTPKQFSQAGLTDMPLIQLAALGDFTFDKLADANNPAYLAATDETRLSQAIKDKALELNYEPVKIYNWVRNNVEWQPTWGGIQSSDLTLASRRGNAMDIASLTIALLRAAKIPARYAHGTVEIPTEAFKNWAGGFSNINAAMTFAASGGIPVTAVTSGGQISKVRLEHIWVEAAIDYLPSRGAKNKDADSWVAMDPAYKQYDYKKGLDVVAISGIDPEQLAQNFIASGTVNDSESWVTGFDATILKNAQIEAQQKLKTYIENNLSNPTVGDVIGGRKTIIQEFPLLLGLPYKPLLTGKRYDKLPATLQQHIRYSFGKDLEGFMLDPIDFPFARVNNEKITLSFKPATGADEQALQALLPDGEITDLSQLPKAIPSYLIRVVPELKVNGETVKTGPAMKLGEELPLVTAVSFAGRGQAQNPRSYNVIAGSYLAVNAYAGSVSPQILKDTKAKLEHTKTVLESADQAQIAALTREDLLGDMFHAGGLGYYAQLIALSHIMGIQADAHDTLAAGTGTFGYEPNVTYFFGFPRSIKPGGVALDIPLIHITAANDGHLEKKKQFTLQTGILSSALEHAVPEQLFVNAQNPGEAISAVKALQKANAAGQRIYHITPANQSAILGNIHHDVDTMNEIRNALNAGKEVITHTDAVSVPGWSGAGYIITDPGTGDGAFKIAGGGNGGFYQWVDNNAGILGLIAAMMGVFPLASAPFLWPLLAFVIAAAIFTIGLILFIDSLEGKPCDDAAIAAYIALGLASVLLGLFLGSVGVVAFILWFTGFLADGAIRSVFTNPVICRR